MNQFTQDLARVVSRSAGEGVLPSSGTPEIKEVLCGVTRATEPDTSIAIAEEISASAESMSIPVPIVTTPATTITTTNVIAREQDSCSTVEGHGRSPRALSGVVTTFKNGNRSGIEAPPTGEGACSPVECAPEIITPLAQLKEEVQFLIDAARAVCTFQGSTNLALLAMSADAAEKALNIKFAGERAEANQVPYTASVTADEESELRNNAPWGSDGKLKAMTSPAIRSTFRHQLACAEADAKAIRAVISRQVEEAEGLADRLKKIASERSSVEPAGNNGGTQQQSEVNYAGGPGAVANRKPSINNLPNYPATREKLNTHSGAVSGDGAAPDISWAFLRRNYRPITKSREERKAR